MSEYLQIETEFRDKKALLDALQECGFEREQIEVYDTPQGLYDYLGNLRWDTANIIIRKEYVGESSNDLGFSWIEDKKMYATQISNFDVTAEARYSKAGGDFMTRLKQSYSKNVVLNKAKAKGYQVQQSKNTAGEVVLKVRVL